MTIKKVLKPFGNLLFILTVLSQTGCGNGKNETAPVEADPIEAATTGLQLNIKNSHSQVRSSTGTFSSPEITKVKVCPVPLDTMTAMGSLNPLASAANFLKFSQLLYRAYNKGLCVSIGDTIAHGTIKRFLVSPEQLNSVYQNGSGSIFFLFNDSFQSTDVPFPCWELPHTIDSNFNKKQVFDIEINDGHNISYSCTTQKTR